MLFKCPRHKAGIQYCHTSLKQQFLNWDLPGETKIHKPVIALLLAEYGLEMTQLRDIGPNNRTIGATSRISKKEHPPGLHSVKETKREGIRARAISKFYDIVPNRIAVFLYPLKNPSKAG